MWSFLSKNCSKITHELVFIYRKLEFGHFWPKSKQKKHSACNKTDYKRADYSRNACKESSLFLTIM